MTSMVPWITSVGMVVYIVLWTHMINVSGHKLFKNLSSGCFIQAVHLWMFILHVPLQIEFFELGKPTKAQKTDNLSAQVVTKVPFSPDPFEGSTIIDASGHPLKIHFYFFKFLIILWTRAVLNIEIRTVEDF